MSESPAMNTFLEKTLFLFKRGIGLLLFLLFIAFFAIPSMDEYLKKETIFIETKSQYSKNDFPVISITRSHANRAIIKDDCFSRNDLVDLALECLRNYTFEFNDTIIDMRQNVYMGDNLSLKKSSWKMGFWNSYFGRTYASGLIVVQINKADFTG